MKKENVLQSVQNSVSSIFTKDDVLNLISSIEQEQQTNQVYDLIKKLQDLQERLTYNLQNLNSDDVVDFDSVEFSISYNNRIEVDGMNINVDNLTEVVENGIGELIDELREEELNREVEEEVSSSEYIPVQENEDKFERESREIESIEQENEL